MDGDDWGPVSVTTSNDSDDWGPVSVTTSHNDDGDKCSPPRYYHYHLSWPGPDHSWLASPCLYQISSMWLFTTHAKIESHTLMLVSWELMQ